jgi:hypothetical protein
MHFSVLVKLDRKPSDLAEIEEMVWKALEPFYETELDAWQIGGRWTGYLDGYRPEQDSANLEPCSECEGSGRVAPNGDRLAEKATSHLGRCERCRGSGETVMWPVLWAPHEGAVQPIAKILLKERLFIPMAFVDGREWRSCQKWVRTPRKDDPWAGKMVQDERWPEHVLEFYRRHSDLWAVIVDCHR